MVGIQIAECGGQTICNILYREERKEHKQLQPLEAVNLRFGFFTKPK